MLSTSLERMDTIRTIGSVRVGPRLLQHWQSLLVTEPEPLFLPDALRASLPPDVLVLTRAEALAMIPDLAWRDSYQTYAVHPSAEWIGIMPSARFRALPVATQQALLVAQGQLGRGQVYAWESIAPLVPDDLRQHWASHRRFVTDAGAFLALDAPAWRELPVTVRENWLVHFVSQQQAPYPTLHFKEIRWRRPPPHAATLRSLANRFPAGSGPNCFATTLAAVSSRPGRTRISHIRP